VNNREKVLNKLKKNNSIIKYLIITAIVVLTICFIFLIIYNVALKNKVSVYYTTYTKENDWSKWSKTANTSGNEFDITNIEIKVKKNSSYPTVLVYKKGKWTKTGKESTNEIKGLQIVDTAELLQRYELCYRTYNKKNKWMDWECDGKYSGNSNYSIKKIEIKYISRNDLRYEVVKDYTKKDVKSIGF
jgi:hypothetical protein